MRKYLLFSLAIIASIQVVHAQPVLTAANFNPVIGEQFYGYTADTAGVTYGLTGAAVTWNYAFLHDISSDTVTYMSCAATPYCDSFPASNIAWFATPGYGYGITTSGIFVEVGSYIAGSIDLHFRNYVNIAYPFTYGNVRTDTAYATQYAIYPNYYRIIDSFFGDGYGTLILPTGTYSNVLRKHTAEVTADTAYYMGSYSVTLYRQDFYSWFDTGLHTSVLDITTDTAGSTATYVSHVSYSAHAPHLLGVNNSANSNTGLEVFPNPAGNIVHLKFTLDDPRQALITLEDMTGRIAATITGDEMNNGMNDIAIPVSGLPEGMYIVHLISSDKSVSQKIIVSR